MKRLALMVMAATLMLAFTTKVVMSQEKAKAEKAKMAPAEEKMKASTTTKVLLENDRVRVSDTRFPPGYKSEIKERPDRVRYVIKGGELRRHYPDGKTENYKLKAGEADFTKKDKTASENVGKTEVHWIGVQLK